MFYKFSNFYLSKNAVLNAEKAQATGRRIISPLPFIMYAKRRRHRWRHHVREKRNGGGVFSFSDFFTKLQLHKTGTAAAFRSCGIGGGGIGGGGQNRHGENTKLKLFRICLNKNLLIYINLYILIIYRKISNINFVKKTENSNI